MHGLLKKYTGDAIKCIYIRYSFYIRDRTERILLHVYTQVSIYQDRIKPDFITHVHNVLYSAGNMQH